MKAGAARIGVRLPVAGPLSSPEAIRRVAVEAEALGFDDLWLHDLIAWSRIADETHISCGSREAVDDAGEYAPPRFFESVTTLAFLAGITSRIRLGVSVLILPWREPIVTAKQITNIDVLSGGRLNLGIGVGGSRASHTKEFELLGRDRRSKYARTRELLQSMKVLWSERRPQFHGTTVQFDFEREESEFNPKPVQQPHPPIWVGGAGPKSMAIAAELADGWIPLWLTPEDYRKRGAEFRRLAEQAGRDGTQLELAGTFPASIAATDEEAWAVARRTVESMLQGYADALTIERVRDTSLFGSPARIASRLAEYVDAGCDAFELRFIYPTVDHLIDQLALFREEVFPALGKTSAPPASPFRREKHIGWPH